MRSGLVIKDLGCHGIAKVSLLLLVQQQENDILAGAAKGLDGRMALNDNGGKSPKPTKAA
jgi:hypothetical protein